MATTTDMTSATAWPLKRTVPTYTGKSPSATTDETQAYRDMLGSQAAGEEVGLFYQLNQAALSNTDTASSSTSSSSGFTPLEANSAYA